MPEPTPRPGPPELYGLRVRTPRLELRLGSRDELIELARLAERGIHGPDEMPFAIAWTDGIGSPGFIDDFVGFHESALAQWTPGSWSLHLLVWHERALIGTQGLIAPSFAAERVVETGSWLGRAYQGRGLGTEMRAGILELAFGGLGAGAATSAWLEGNEASRRVSEKLGYRVTGEVTREPRPGDVVRAWAVRLDAGDWRSPIPVAVDGLEPSRPHFA